MDKKLPLLKQVFRSFLWLTIIVTVAISIRLFLIEIYLIPSQSMQPTIMAGDIVLVSKGSYGPRLSGFTDDKYDYYRLGRISGLKRYDIVVFNYPMADSALSKYPTKDYYQIKAKASYNGANDSLIYRPVKYRQPYIKRCIGLPGDTIMLKGDKPYINGNKALSPVDDTNDTTTWVIKSGYRWRQFPLSADNPKFWGATKGYRIIFPNNYVYNWRHEIFGPVVVPKKGITIKLDLVNVWLYKRAIEAYERNTVKVSPDGIFINGVKTDSYTFKMNYFFMMGDNRGNSIDSVYWGFVPEDHIIGKALLVLFSKDKNGINWTRILKRLK